MIGESEQLHLVNALFVIVFFIIYVENFECIVLQTETRLVEAAEKDELLNYIKTL